MHKIVMLWARQDMLNRTTNLSPPNRKTEFFRTRTRGFADSGYFSGYSNATVRIGGEEVPPLCTASCSVGGALLRDSSEWSPEHDRAKPTSKLISSGEVEQKPQPSGSRRQERRLVRQFPYMDSITSSSCN